MAISLDGLYSGYDNMYGSNNKIDADKLENSVGNINAQSTDDELMQVCKDFEAYFAEQVFKSMEKLIPRSEEKSDYMEMFGDTLTQEYAKSATEQGDGLGLAQMLYEQMKRNFSID